MYAAVCVRAYGRVHCVNSSKIRPLVCCLLFRWHKISFDYVLFRYALQVSLVFITSDLLASGSVNMATVLVFVLTSCYYVVLARRRMSSGGEEGEVLDHL